MREGVASPERDIEYQDSGRAEELGVRYEMKRNKTIIRNGRLFASQEQANASSSFKRIRRPPSYVAVSCGGIRITEKRYAPSRKSRRLRRKVRRIAFGKRAFVLDEDKVIIFELK